MNKLVFVLMFSMAIPVLLGSAQEADAAATMIIRDPDAVWADVIIIDEQNVFVPFDCDATNNPNIAIFPDIPPQCTLAGDLQLGVPGAVGFIGNLPLSNWNLDLFFGLTKPAIGSEQEPEVDLFLLANSAGADRVQVIFTDDSFPNTFQTYIARAGVGGTTVGSVSYQTFWDPDNVQFAQQTLIAEFLGLGVGAFSDQVGIPLVINDIFSLTQIVSIDHSVTGLTSLDANLMLSPSVGGFELPIDNVSLVLAGVQSSLLWIYPLVAVLGAGITYFKLKKK